MRTQRLSDARDTIANLSGRQPNLDNVASYLVSKIKDSRSFGDNSVPITFSTTETQHETLNRFCAKHNIKKSTLVKYCVQLFLDDLEQQEN